MTITTPTPQIIPRPEHTISREHISSAALKVLYRLHQAGFRALLVGGCVRDLLLGQEPKDFDVATDARPQEIKQLFTNCRLIGRRFRIAHIHFSNEIIEVTTFRAIHNFNDDMAELSTSGMILQDNVYGALEEDVFRRDFTINALYYDIADFSVIDYVNGLQDLKSGTIRMIGEAEKRLKEDPVRILRALRLKARFDFKCDETLEKSLQHSAELLEQVPPARVFNELSKLFLLGRALPSWELMREYGVISCLFPILEHSEIDQEQLHDFVKRCLKNCDDRVSQGKPVTLAFVIAAMFWLILQERLKSLPEEHFLLNLQDISFELLDEIARLIACPRRILSRVRDIWLLQYQLERRRSRNLLSMFTRTSFRSGYDFLLLRAEANPELQPLSEWWQAFVHANEEERARIILECKRQERRQRRRRTA